MHPSWRSRDDSSNDVTQGAGGLVTADIWVFGYGSLVWRPDFPFAERRPAFIEGWARRFWQGSTDHRGVPGAPGRVVTLVTAPGARCWGMAYRVAAADSAAVLSHLDYREKGGYRVEHVTLGFADRPATDGLVYRATPDNPNYLGPAAPEAIAAQVRASRGPSGPNIDYVLRLAEALREIDAEDAHVFGIERLLREGAEVA
jgi:cation transport regulator ChaC